ncbi:uncharacterized protein LOC144638750 isoform X2 [Oculina patagonica]
MDAFRICLCYVLLYTVKLSLAFERLACDDSLTRREITTILGRKVNLGCYVNKTNTGATPQTQAQSPLMYDWFKDNQSVPQTENSEKHENVLVITPKDDKDFGIYTCNVTNGISRTECIITLKRGWTKAEHVTIVTGCVNISVLMPVLAVAVLSFLLFIHLVTRKRMDKKDPATPQDKHGQRRKPSVVHPHTEQRLETRRLSRDLLYNSFREQGTNNNESKQAVVSIEMHVGGDLHSTPDPETKTGQNVQRERKKGFYNRSFRDASIDLDDIDVTEHMSGKKGTEEGDSPKDIAFFNTNFKNDSMDSIESPEDRDYSMSSVVAVFGESRGSEEGKDFNHKILKNESVESGEESDEVFVNKSAGAVLDKSKSGNRKGFYNKTFHSDSMDVSDDSTSVSGETATEEAKHVPSSSLGAVLDKSKSGNRKGFFNKTFHSDSWIWISRMTMSRMMTPALQMIQRQTRLRRTLSMRE